MELELAIVESCDECGCRVRPLGQAGTLSVTYSAAVQDRIRIRQGDLVAVNLAASLPEIVWRWWQAEVLRPLQEAPAAAGHVVIGSLGIAAHARIARPGLELAPGERTWIAKSDRGVEVIDRMVGGEPEQPEWIRRRWFPLIEAEYAALDVAG